MAPNIMIIVLFKTGRAIDKYIMLGGFSPEPFGLLVEFKSFFWLFILINILAGEDVGEIEVVVVFWVELLGEVGAEGDVEEAVFSTRKEIVSLDNEM